MLRFFIVVSLALTLQGCGWLVRDVADFENVDMVRAEPLDANEKGGLRNALEGFSANHDSAAVRSLRGKCKHDPLSSADNVAPGSPAVPLPTNETAVLNAVEAQCMKGTYLYWKYLARYASASAPGSVAPKDSSSSLPTDSSSVAAKDTSSDKPKDPDSGHAEAQTIDPAAAQKYFDTGTALSDALCEEWFARLGDSNVAMAEAGNTIKDAGTAASLIFDATGAATIARTSVTAGTTFFGNAAYNISNTYLIAPDLGEVARKVRNYRLSYLADIKNSGNQMDFASASSYLQKYHSTCSADWVRTYLNKSLQISQPAPANSSGTSTGGTTTASTTSGTSTGGTTGGAPVGSAPGGGAAQASGAAGSAPAVGASGATQANSATGGAQPANGESTSPANSAIYSYISGQLQPLFKNKIAKEQVVYLYGLILPETLDLKDEKNCALYGFASNVPELVSISGGAVTLIPATKVTAAKALASAKSLLGNDSWKDILKADALAKVATSCKASAASSPAPHKFVPVMQPDVIGTTPAAPAPANAATSAEN